ncbi:alpha/beta-hydrolase [Terfezia boudieri ATCC MYA-4762]|uniref:cutinase n=1 Tax=Terfezia boudieri ATCC MYA-4762 TaxID=1051890 RepID=A0A3N4M062_9PEZI|nr:alpha/beta-hydrolase [Terfezia boudieri ATCC MYA-4762]
MIPPTVTPTTGSTTLSPYSINLAMTTSEPNSSPLPPTPPHQPGINPSSLKGIHNLRERLLIIPTDLPSICGCCSIPPLHMGHEASCFDVYKDIKSHILHEAVLVDAYKDMNPQEEVRVPNDIITYSESESLQESQVKPESPSDTALTLPAHNTLPRSIPSLESFPNPLPGNLTSCPPVELIFARGTGEPSGLGRIGRALYIELMREYPNMTAYGVFYDASAYKGKVISSGRLEEGGKDIEGRVGMWVELEGEQGQCKETRIVLGGFSLGAAVLQKTKLTPEEQERVDAVVIFGYPWNLRPHKHAQYPLDSEKVWTKCIPQDPVCNFESIFTDGTFVAHKGYVDYVEEAVEFIRKKVRKVENQEENGHFSMLMGF